MKYIKKIFIGVIVAFTFWFVDTYMVNAATNYEYSVYYPSSTIGGLHFNNSNSYTSVDPNSDKTLGFNVMLEASSPNYDISPHKQGELINFKITYCISKEAYASAVYSSLSNYFDLNYATDNVCAIGSSGNYWYGQVVQYAFVRLAINSVDYDDVEGTTPLNIWRYTFNTQSLNIHNSASYGASFRFISIEYMNDTDYYSAINNYEDLKKQNETNSKLDEAENTRKGIFQSLKDGISSIGNWFTDLGNKIGQFFTDLLNGILEGLKSLFVPSDEQLYEIINESKDLTENFGFVGESMNFFITIFTSLLGMVNANGCIELPEFTIGSTSLFDSHTFWEAQNVCLNDNVVLSSNITTIRIITSIVLVGLFVGFASRQFFKMLSKEESDT